MIWPERLDARIRPPATCVQLRAPSPACAAYTSIAVPQFLPVCATRTTIHATLLRPPTICLRPQGFHPDRAGHKGCPAYEFPLFFATQPMPRATPIPLPTVFLHAEALQRGCRTSQEWLDYLRRTFCV